MKANLAGILGGILFFPWALFPFGKQEKPKPAEQTAPVVLESESQDGLVSGQIVEITGRVRLVGNMPFPYLVITDQEDRDWYVDEGDRKTLAGFEQQILRVRGTLDLVELILANNQHIGTRRILKHITIQNLDSEQ